MSASSPKALFELMLWLWSVCEGHGGRRLVAWRDKRSPWLLPRQLCHGDTTNGKPWSESVTRTAGHNPLSPPQNQLVYILSWNLNVFGTNLNCQSVFVFNTLPWNDSLKFPQWKEVVKSLTDDVLTVLTTLTWAFSVTPPLVWRR